jgi:hypothetical protein
MGAEQRIQLMLGQLYFRIAVLESELEEAQKRLAELQPNDKLTDPA